MARKFNSTYHISENFYDYNYIINGVAGIGKTYLAHHLGIAASGSNEGTFIITCGREPEPTHIPDNPFGAHAKTFKEVDSILKELIENKAEYPHTKFIAFDSIDELFRIAEQYVIAEWNSKCNLDEKAKSISQAYKGFQKGENRVCEIIVNMFGKIIDAGYHVIFIGHTKMKTTSDIYSGVSFDQITCAIDSKYYNLIKDKVNLVATCYYEKEIADIEEVKDAFTKKMKKKGNLISQKKVIVFADDDNAIDTKSHFSKIVPKIDFSTEGFVKAVEDAIKAQKDCNNNVSTDDIIEPEIKPKTKPVEPNPIEDSDDDFDSDIESLDESSEETDIDEVADTDDIEEVIAQIREQFKAMNRDKQVKFKEYLDENNIKLDQVKDISLARQLLEMM